MIITKYKAFNTALALKYDVDNSITSVACICYEINRVYRELNKDYSQKNWDKASDKIILSTIDWVAFYKEHPEATPKGSHESWLEHKIKEGWIEGIFEDEELKTHPALVPYDELPEEQKFKDIIFKTVCDAIFSN